MKRLSVVLVVALLLTFLLPLPVAAKNAIPGALPPNSNPYGSTYGEWSAEWWKWALELPTSQNPFFDENGSCVNGANGQSGKVWFLTGVINVSGVAVRNCTVPAGKALFFPLINVECSTVEGDGITEAELRACVDGYTIATLTQWSVKIDDKEISFDPATPAPELAKYYVESPPFGFTLPADNWLGLPAGSAGQAVSGGYYLLLAPLSTGKHTIHFTANYADGAFTLDITYNLTVKRGDEEAGRASHSMVAVEGEPLTFLPFVSH